MGRASIAEQELAYWGQKRSAALVLLASTATPKTLASALESVRTKRYLSDVILVLTEGAGIDGSLLLSHSEQPRIRIVQSDSPRLGVLQQRLENTGLKLPHNGAARALWYALGYVMAASPAEVIAVSNSRQLKPDLLSGCVYPLISPYAGMEICKVCGGADEPEAELLSPLFEALERTFCPGEHLHCLSCFFQPLSKGLAFNRSLVGGLRLPALRDVQLGLLSELQRRVPINNLCQVDTGSRAPLLGVQQCTELVTLLLENLRSEGMILSKPLAHSVKLTFQQLAINQLASSRGKSTLGGFRFNEHELEMRVERFAEIVFSVGCRFASGQEAVLSLPSWKRTMHAFPDALTHLNAAVEQDFSELVEASKAIPAPVASVRSVEKPGLRH